MKAKDLCQLGDKLFEQRTGLLAGWQTLAENFYPERADFTATRTTGADFCSHLTTSYPIIVRRDLANSFDTMLRPTQIAWFHLGVVDEDFSGDNDARRFLEYLSDIQRRAMYDRVTQFARAIKEGDHDFSCFGQTVLQIERVMDNLRVGPHLLYRCWHLRDVAWQESRYGMIGCVFRKWKPCARDLMAIFPGKTHQDVGRKAAKDPFATIDCRHMVVESDMYDEDYAGVKMDMPYVSIYYDAMHHQVIEARGVWSKGYVIPRWQTLSGSQYAYSPAAVTALPDARLIQAMSATLLEAGEKAVTPPMWAQSDVLRTDLDVRAGGLTIVDSQYDERSGEPIHLMVNDKSGIPLGIDMLRDSRNMLAEAFYINKITPPLLTSNPNMTAFQAGQIVQEYIRQATPLFAPMEVEYNGAVCDETFEIMFGTMLRMEAKGVQTPLNIPRSLRGADIQFRFESPLHDAIEKQKLTKFMEMKQVLAEGIALDPSIAAMADVKVTVRDVLQAVAPAKWLRSEAEMADIEMAEKQRQQAQELLATMQAGANVAATGARAARDMAVAQ